MSIGPPYTILAQALQVVVCTTGAPVFLTGAPVGAMAPVGMPVVGDTVMFLSAAFQVYDDFPTGAPVRPHVAFVDWRNMFAVEDVRQALYAVPRPRGRRRRHGPPPDELLVAVQLRSTNDTLLWSVFSHGEHARMEICDPSLILV